MAVGSVFTQPHTSCVSITAINSAHGFADVSIMLWRDIAKVSCTEEETQYFLRVIKKENITTMLGGKLHGMQIPMRR